MGAPRRRPARARPPRRDASRSTRTRSTCVPIAQDAALDAMAALAPKRVVTRDRPTSPRRRRRDARAAAARHRRRMPQPGCGGASRPPPGRSRCAGATLARLGVAGRPPRGRPADARSRSTDSRRLRPPVHAGRLGPIVLAEENKLRQVRHQPDGQRPPLHAPTTARSRSRCRSTDRDATRAVLEVIDHGEGIPPQIREKIFQRFWRADTSRTRETGGSGLGLAIVSSIVAAHNGDVEVVETPGGGATFRVSLPLLRSPRRLPAGAAADGRRRLRAPDPGRPSPLRERARRVGAARGYRCLDTAQRPRALIAIARRRWLHGQVDSCGRCALQRTGAVRRIASSVSSGDDAAPACAQLDRTSQASRGHGLATARLPARVSRPTWRGRPQTDGVEESAPPQHQPTALGHAGRQYARRPTLADRDACFRPRAGRTRTNRPASRERETGRSRAMPARAGVAGGT